MNEKNLLKRLLCRLFKQEHWFELTYAFYMWGPRRKLRDIHIWFHNLIWPYNIIKIEQLDRNWHDRDGVMFHAIFQILVDFVEKEKPFQPHTDENEREIKRIFSPQEMRDFMDGWLGEEATEKSIQSYIAQGWVEADAREALSNNYQYTRSLELISIYEWYKFKRPQRQEYVHNIVRNKRRKNKPVDFFDELDDLEDELNRKIKVKHEKFITSNEYFEIENERDLVDEVMMYKLLALRKHLWT